MANRTASTIRSSSVSLWQAEAVELIERAKPDLALFGLQTS
jgi:hypothetical protein